MSYPFCSLCPQEQSGKTKLCEIEALRAGRSDTTNIQYSIATDFLPEKAQNSELSN